MGFFFSFSVIPFGSTEVIIMSNMKMHKFINLTESAVAVTYSLIALATVAITNPSTLAQSKDPSDSDSVVLDFATYRSSCLHDNTVQRIPKRNRYDAFDWNNSGSVPDWRSITEDDSYRYPSNDKSPSIGRYRRFCRGIISH